MELASMTDTSLAVRTTVRRRVPQGERHGDQPQHHDVDQHRDRGQELLHVELEHAGE
jgi:hypothetical protein